MMLYYMDTMVMNANTKQHAPHIAAAVTWIGLLRPSLAHAVSSMARLPYQVRRWLYALTDHPYPSVHLHSCCMLVSGQLYSCTRLSWCKAWNQRDVLACWSDFGGCTGVPKQQSIGGQHREHHPELVLWQ